MQSPKTTRIIDVVPAMNIPLAQPQIFSFYCSFAVERYSLVRVPIRKKMIPALVVGISEIGENKAELRSQTYILRGGVEHMRNAPVLSAAYVMLMKFLAEYYMSSLGLALKTALPQYIFKRKHFPETAQAPARPTREKIERAPEVFMGGVEERKSFYRAEIKKTLKEGRQILVLVPDHHALSAWLPAIAESAGKKRIVVLTSDLGEKDFFLRWKSVRDNAVDVVVGTRGALFCDFYDLGLIIVENESDPSYKSWDMHPKYDARTMCIVLARHFGVRLIFSDLVVRMETFYRAKQKHFLCMAPSPLVMRRPPLFVRAGRDVGEGESVFSEEARRILLGMKNHESAFVLLNRRGSARMTLCVDCGNVATCKRCSAPLVLHRDKTTARSAEKDILLCHHCGFSTSVPLVCSFCGGARIREIGAGTEKAEEELNMIVGANAVFRADSDMDADDTKRLDAFIGNAPKVMVGTSWALRALPQKFDHIIVARAEEMLYFPDFRSEEYFIRTVFELSERAKKTFIIQSYRSPHPLFDALQKNTPLETLFEKELAVRKSLLYPPYSNLVKIVCKDVRNERAKNAATEAAHALKNVAAHENARGRSNFEVLGPAPAFIFKKRNEYRWNLILKDTAKDYKVRKRILLAVKGACALDVDPVDVL